MVGKAGLQCARMPVGLRKERERKHLVQENGMFESLTDKLTGIFNRLSSKGRLTEKDIDDALSQVRRSLLEADVNFRVARDFVARVKERSLGADVLESLTPGQQVVKVVHEELTEMLSGGDHRGDPRQPASLSADAGGFAGLGQDHYRSQAGPPVAPSGTHIPPGCRRLAPPCRYIPATDPWEASWMCRFIRRTPKESTVPQVVRNGVERARQQGLTWAIIDTGGRLHIDDELMEELEEARSVAQPHETLLVVDAMTGQDAVNAAQEFHQRINLTGLVMTKMDGDARGGAALSVTRVTGVPIKFLGVGERPDGLEQFHPDRLASRILAMGDVLTLIEKAQDAVDEKQAKELERKFRQATFDLEDFLQQIQSVKKMGSLNQIMEMIPGMNNMSRKMPADFDDDQIKRVEAIIQSMTVEERRRPEILNGSRRRRIARGQRHDSR